MIVSATAPPVIQHFMDYMPHDPAALAARLTELHENPALARAMGRAGIRRARSMFTWEKVTQQLVEVYQSVRQSQAIDLPEPAWRQLHLVPSERAFAP